MARGQLVNGGSIRTTEGRTLERKQDPLLFSEQDPLRFITIYKQKRADRQSACGGDS